MKKYILAIAICFFTFLSFSQNCADTFYRKGYYDAGMVLQSSENIITRDGATVIAGRHINRGNDEIALFITKITPVGNVVWSKKLPNGLYNPSTAIKGIKQLNNGNLVLVYTNTENSVTSSMHIILLNTAGNLLWAKKLTPVNDEMFLNAQIAVTSDNDIIIATTIDMPGDFVPLIIKMDYSGNILYNRWFAGNTCSSATITGVATDKNTLYAFGRIGGCPIPANAEIDENVFAFKMDHQTGELLLSRSYFSTRTHAYPSVKTMYQWVFGDIVKSNEDHFYVSDRFYSFAQNRFGLINTTMDTLLNFSGGRLFSNDQMSATTYRFGATDPAGNWSVYTALGENNNTMYIATIDKSGRIVRERKMPFSANEAISYGGKYPLHYNHQYLNVVSNYLRNGNSYLQLYQTGPDNAADPCFGEDTSFVQLEPFPIIPHHDDYFTYTGSIQLAESDPGISVSDINLIEENYCRQISHCSFLNIKPAVTNICDTTQTYIFTASKDAECLKQVLWQAGDTTAGVITPLNDSSVAITFKKQWQGYLYASLSSCMDLKDSIRINVLISPDKITLGADTAICKNDSLVLRAGAGFKEYHWQDGSGDSLFIVKQPGLYTVIAMNYCGTSFNGSITVAMNDPDIIDLGPDTTICSNQPLILDAGAGFSSYLWQDGSTGSSVPVRTPGKYRVTVRNAYGCVSSDSVTIARIIQAPTGFLPAGTAICATDSFIIHPLKLFREYLWSTGSIANSITVKTPGVYRLLVVDDDGCIGLDSISLLPKDCGSGFFIPDAFTPNNDGINDSFKPLISGRVSDYEFTVYNVYGQIVFSSRRPGEGWDGRHRKLPQNTGTYVWICRYTANEVSRFSKGSVLLVR